MNNEFKQLVDDRLSGLEWQQRQSNAVLNQIKGEIKMKKKLSVGLVLTIVSVLVVMTALAAALLWEQQVVPMKEIEQTEGDYINWPVSQKQVLIRALIDSGHIVESSETVRLFDESTDETEKNAIADQLVLALTGQTDVKEISVDIITYAIMGASDTWTPEQRVWWQQVTEQFHGNQGALDTLIVPSKDVISEAEAVAIAKAAVLAAYELPADGLDSARPVADMYVTEQRPDYRRWDIQFKLFRDGSDSYVDRVYSVIVDETGEVIGDPDVGMPSLEESAARYKGLPREGAAAIYDVYMNYIKRTGSGSVLWPLELKAEFSQVVAPQVREIVKSGDLAPLDSGMGTDLDLIALSSYTYGLPEKDDITQEAALSIAKRSIMEHFQLDSEVVELYDECYFYFDITNLDVSLWKIVLLPSIASVGNFPEIFPDGFVSGQGNLRYKVEINSRTSEVTKVEEFEYPVIGIGDLEYKLMLY